MEQENKDNGGSRSFPKGFMWCAATASYQVEGGYNEDDKSPNIWDAFTHLQGHILNNDNGDIACDSYHKINEDVDALKKLGVSHYRFSLSWSRILPQGTPDFINPKGIAYYNKLIDSLIENGIQPVISLFHWDLPQCLQEKFSGWMSREIVACFTDYADICFSTFGDRVKLWVTINEPQVICTAAYGSGMMAPGMKSKINFSLDVGHHLILAHVEVWHLYDTKYRNLQKGIVGTSNYCEWKEPYSNLPEDVEAAERSMEISVGIFCEPIFGSGDYPTLVKSRFKTLKDLGIIPADVNMPVFSEQEVLRNRGSSDFFGLNYYTSCLVNDIEDSDEGLEEPSSPLVGPDFDLIGKLSRSRSLMDPKWKSAASSWLCCVPWGLKKLLKYLKNRFKNYPILILENGYSDINGKLDDSDRIEYIKSHIAAVAQAIEEDGVNVIGYTAWSLLDNFEWERGYSEKFGLFRVDQKDPERKRIMKKSAEFYASVIKNNCIPSDELVNQELGY